MPAPLPQPDVPQTAEPADNRLDELAQIVDAYNRVTENLHRSHEALADEVRRLQQELASTDAQLQRSKRLAALGEMAAGIAHEIRNPLAAIHLYAKILVEDLSAEAETGQTAAKIADAVRGLNAIVCDVLTFAREIEPRRAALPVHRLFARVEQAMAPALGDARLEVEANDAAKSVCLHADADLMHQVLLNLVRNAVEAGAGRIVLTADREDDLARVTVRDDGPGIDNASIDRIFNPFFTTRNTGTGLGLAIVHRIVDAHGGAISVHNHGGAVFELALPAWNDHAGEDEDPDENTTPSAKTPCCGAAA